MQNNVKGENTMNTLAPIVLFVYNRPWHTEQTVTALLKNELADASDLIVYSDAPKNEAVVPMVEGVRSFIKGIRGFKSVSIIERERNWGLADNIIDGVTAVVNKHGRVIVLEDDIVTSPYFLRFMNDALDFYENEENVWHVSGYMFPIDTTDLNDTFFTQGMFCWGWATWARAWKHYTRDPQNTPSQFNKKMAREFDYENTNKFFDQLRANKSGKLHTWAIFWYATIYLHKALCLSSKNSLTQNIGLDGSGIHCGESDVYEVALRQNAISAFEQNIQESATARNRLIHFFKHVQPNMFFRIRRKLLRTVKKLAAFERWNG
jgi:GT2 family glycosyltransferase